MTTLGDVNLVKVAFGLLAAMPGIPMIYAGDEIGQEGDNGEDGRRPFPWRDQPQQDETHWNVTILDWVRAVLGERRNIPALRDGGRRWVSATDDSLTFLREAASGSVLVHATRGRSTSVQLPVNYFGRHLHGLTEYEVVTIGCKIGASRAGVRHFRGGGWRNECRRATGVWVSRPARAAAQRHVRSASAS